MSNTAHDRLLGIQLARGVAAMLVLLYHTGRLIALPQYVGVIPFDGIFNFGHAGVDFFFTLSGFIIVHVHFGDIGRPQRLARYVWRRVSRIYPVYWLVTVLLLVIAAFKPSGSDGFSTGFLLRSLMLLPQPSEPILGVGWTLVHEMFFYSVFAVLIAARRIGLLVVVGWLSLVLYDFFLGLDGPYILRFAASFAHVQFLLGGGAAILLHRHSIVPRPRAVALAGMLGFLFVGMVENAGGMLTGGWVSQLLFGLASMTIIIGIVSAERAGQMRVGRIGEFFGAASYSLYLIHTVVISLTARLLMSVGLVKILPGSMVFVLGATAATLAGCLLYMYAERPMIAALQRIGSRQLYGARS